MTTNGIKLYYAPETTAGTRPTTGWKQIPDVTNLPRIGSTPDTIEVTPLEETEYKQYEKGLKDTGAVEITANMSKKFLDAWEDAQAAYDTADAEGLALWFVAVHPKFEKAFYFSGEPDDIPLPESGSNAAWQPTPSIVVKKTHGWDTKPTISD